MPQLGRLELICGCMFAGKTKLLIERLSEAQRAGRRVLAIKHALDARYESTAMATHDGERFPAYAMSDADEVARRAVDADVIGLDEGQFFGARLIDVAAQLKSAGKRLIVAGIDFDAWKRPFPPFPQLKALADQIDVRTAPCRACGQPARHSQRMVPVTDEFMVGGLESYEPRCGDCFVPLPQPAPDYSTGNG